MIYEEHHATEFKYVQVIVSGAVEMSNHIFVHVYVLHAQLFEGLFKPPNSIAIAAWLTSLAVKDLLLLNCLTVSLNQELL